jgi:hypothetical protein
MAEETGAARFKQLPEPVRFEDLITSQDAVDHPEEKRDDVRETEWMLRTSVL